MGNFSCLFVVIFFKMNFFWKNLYGTNGLDPDQAQQNVGPDLGTNCLQRFSADESSRKRVQHTL